jgi:myo-inositol catabolism protein IolC
MTEAQAGTRDTPVPHASRPLLILAADHRSRLERDLYGLTAAPTPEQAAWISADKMLIYQALLDAVPELPASVQPGILIDEQYGAAIAELTARAGGGISLAMPVEAGGEQWFRYAYDDWQAHAGFFATDYAKILIRDNPGLEPGQRAAQADRLADVSDWAAANDRALIVELLVPATAADLAASGGAVASYDVTLRPERTRAGHRVPARPRGGTGGVGGGGPRPPRRRGRDRRGRQARRANRRLYRPRRARK